MCGPCSWGIANSQNVIIPLSLRQKFAASVSSKVGVFLVLNVSGCIRKVAGGAMGSLVSGRGHPKAWPREKLPGLYLTRGEWHLFWLTSQRSEKGERRKLSLWKTKV